MSAIHNHAALGANSVARALAPPQNSQGVSAGAKALTANSSSGTTGTGSSTGSTSSSSSDGSDITSSDFLTLLVSELKNQDPTQPTDPNAYVQQLVGVNSLQQLISINQELA
jgi:flagellar basal-body rod modification protein FlgD